MILADTPLNWPEPPPMSTLEGLLIFAGIPLLLVAAITVMVVAPSLAKGNQPRSGRSWQADPEWFGAPRAVGAADVMANHRQIESGSGDGYDPASAGDHDNVTMDDPGEAGDRDLPTGADAAGTSTPTVTTWPDDPSSDRTGGASVRW